MLTSCCSSAVAEAQAVTDATSALAIDKEFVLAGLLAVYEAGVRRKRDGDQMTLDVVGWMYAADHRGARRDLARPSPR